MSEKKMSWTEDLLLSPGGSKGGGLTSGIGGSLAPWYCVTRAPHALCHTPGPTHNSTTQSAAQPKCADTWIMDLLIRRQLRRQCFELGHGGVDITTMQHCQGCRHGCVMKGL